jgi:hypothetical protein
VGRRARARNLGPTLIEFSPIAPTPHSTSDDPAPTARRRGARWPLGDPIDRLKQHLIALGEWSETSTPRWSELDEVKAARRRRRPRSYGTLGVKADQRRETMFEDVFKEVPALQPQPQRQEWESDHGPMNMIQAINSALDIMMARHPTVVSSARMSAISAACSAHRRAAEEVRQASACFDTPINEGGIAATAIGMASTACAR